MNPWLLVGAGTVLGAVGGYFIGRASHRPTVDTSRLQPSSGLPDAAPHDMASDVDAAWLASPHPGNPYALAEALGRPARTREDLAKALGLPLKAIFEPGGLLYNPAAMVAMVLKGPTAPSGAIAKHAGQWARDGAAALYAREAQKQYAPKQPRGAKKPETGAPKPGVGTDGPMGVDEILTLLGQTPASWMDLPCAAQLAALRELQQRTGEDASVAWFRIYASLVGVYGPDESMPWARTGDYSRNAVSVLDPCQGFVGNCYYIAALASTAWVRPDIIQAAHYLGADARSAPLLRTPDSITLWQPVSMRGVAAGEHRVVLSDRVQVIADPRISRPGGQPLCVPFAARGVVPSQSWPALWEKACAMVVAQNGSDYPRMVGPLYMPGIRPEFAVSGGRGLSGVCWRCRPHTANDVWRYLLEHCDADGRATSVLSTGTRSQGEAPHEEYQTVAEHGYSVLGHATMGGRRMVIVRNPWGHQPPRGPSGTWLGLRLGEGGVGALPIDALMRLCAGVGGNWYGEQRWGDELDYGA